MKPRQYKQIPEKNRNEMTAELKRLCQKYGKDEMRLVANKYFARLSNEEKLQKEIARREEELKKLKEELP